MAGFTKAQKELLEKISRVDNLEDAVMLCKKLLEEPVDSAPAGVKTLEDLLSGMLVGNTYQEDQIQAICFQETGYSAPTFLFWALETDFSDVIKAVRATPELWGTVYGGRIVGLGLGRELIPKLEPITRSFKATGGVSRPFTDLCALRSFCDQALVTAKTARVLGQTGLSFYDDFLMLRLFDGLREDVDVNDFALPDVQVLRDYDKQRGAELCKTLLCYLESSKNVSVAAKKLHVHRNTVHYRIGKCREMLPMLKFDEGYVYLLMLSLYIAQYGYYLDNSSHNDNDDT